MTADLDRGLIDAGVTPAEAVARIGDLEDQVDILTAKVRALFACMAETNRAAGLPSEAFREAARATADRGAARRERIDRLGLQLVAGGQR